MTMCTRMLGNRVCVCACIYVCVYVVVWLAIDTLRLPWQADCVAHLRRGKQVSGSVQH